MQRIKTRSQFQAVLACPIVARSAHFALHVLDLTPAPGPGAAALFASPAVWLGALLPKRWARRASTRNAIRRQVYQAGRDAPGGLPRAAHLVRLRAGFDRARFHSASSDALKKAVRGELDQLLRQAVRAERPA